MNKWNKTGIKTVMTEKVKEMGFDLEKINTEKRTVMNYTKVQDDKFRAGPATMMIRSSKVPGMSGDIELWLMNPEDPGHGRLIRNYGTDFPYGFDEQVAFWAKDIKEFLS